MSFGVCLAATECVSVVSAPNLSGIKTRAAIVRLFRSLCGFVATEARARGIKVTWYGRDRISCLMGRDISTSRGIRMMSTRGLCM